MHLSGCLRNTNMCQFVTMCLLGVGNCLLAAKTGIANERDGDRLKDIGAIWSLERDHLLQIARKQTTMKS